MSAAPPRLAPGPWLVLLSLPVAGLVLLLAAPSLDVAWEQHPAHFWLVVLTGIATCALGLLTGEAAARRTDARLLLVSLAYLSSAGFLALHALATPGVLLEASNAGFQVASAVGVLLASVFAAASGFDLTPESAEALVLRRSFLYLGLGALMVVWAVFALAELPPLDDPVTPEGARNPFLAFAAVGTVLYGFAAVRYGRLYRLRPRPLVLAVVASFVLLAEAMFAVALSRNWRLTWWEWHLLILVAVALVARAAWSEWKHEGSPAEIWSDLYEERTLGRPEELSVLFADLRGFTTFSEQTPQAEVSGMLNEYFREVIPAIEAQDGQVVDTAGDAVFAMFRGPHHERRAARAGLDFQEIATRVGEAHPGWPRFRVGVNSGEAFVGLVEARGARKYGPTGDCVNTGARLQGEAGAGEVVIGEVTRTALGKAAEVEDLGELSVKGKEQPVQAFVLRRLAPGGDEGNERLEDHEGEAEG